MTRTIAILASVAALALSGCSGSPTASNNSASASAPGPANSAPNAASAGQAGSTADAANQRLLAAAEPFEVLTESAFSATPAKLDALIADARSAAQSATPAMSSQAAQSLADELKRIAAARKTDARADVAISSVEAYRTLVSSTTGRTAVPQQVSLLDYAGFRTQADLKASPARWSDIAEAVAFAKARWREISAEVKDRALADKMQAAISSMDAASKARDSKSLMQASTRELDLVDLLENYFAKAAPPR